MLLEDADVSSALIQRAAGGEAAVDLIDPTAYEGCVYHDHKDGKECDARLRALKEWVFSANEGTLQDFVDFVDLAEFGSLANFPAEFKACCQK
jgi:hypothetical protein